MSFFAKFRLQLSWINTRAIYLSTWIRGFCISVRINCARSFAGKCNYNCHSYLHVGIDYTSPFSTFVKMSTLCMVLVILSFTSFVSPRESENMQFEAAFQGNELCIRPIHLFKTHYLLLYLDSAKNLDTVYKQLWYVNECYSVLV